jgi:hypothetical protein
MAVPISKAIPFLPFQATSVSDINSQKVAKSTLENKL